MGENNRILAFGPHPDDVEHFCAGTLSILKKKGYEIYIATMCGGEMGSASLGREKIREVRLQECRDAAALLDAEYHWAGGEDIEVEFSHEYRVKTARVLREVDPFLVFTTPPIDYMADHEITSKLVRNACFCAPMPNFDTGEDVEPTERVPYLYFWDAMEGKDYYGNLTPVDIYVDISEEIDIKSEMLKRHRSQREWLLKHHGIDEYVNSMRDWSKKRGEEMAVEYAECFIQYLGHAYPQDNILTEILNSI